MADSDSPWALFGEDEAASAAEPGGSAPAPAPPPTDAPRAPRALVHVPLERTLPDVVRFFSEHAAPALDDLGELASRGVPNSEALKASLSVAASLVGDAAAAGARGIRGTSQAAQELCASLALASSRVVDVAWGVLLQDRSWPHVAFREAYALGQVARAACLGAAGDARGAMAAADLALVMGAPAEELAGLLRSVELGAVMAAGASAAAPGALLAPTLPKIPLVLGPDAFLNLPPGLLLPGARVVPRAVAYTPRHATKGASSRSRAARSKKGGAAQPKPRHASDAPDAGHASPALSAPEEHPLLARLRSVQEAPTDASASAPAASVGTVRPLSLAAFRERFRDPGLPVVLCRSTANWAGADRWRSLEHLAERLGHRTVPVEMGQHLSGLWEEEPMLFREFLERYVAPSVEWGWGRRSRVDAAAAVAAGVVAAGASEGASPRTASATRAATGPMWQLVELPEPHAAGDSGDAALAPTAIAIVHPSAIAYVAQHTLFDQVCVLQTRGASASDCAGPLAAGIYELPHRQSLQVVPMLPQVPALLDDIELPVYAEGEVGSINIWFGTAGAFLDPRRQRGCH